MVSFLYKFISFFLQSLSSLRASTTLVWEQRERIQNAIKLTRSAQPLRKQISPYQRQDTETSKDPRSAKKAVAEPGPGFSRPQPQLQTSRAGVAAVLFITLLSYRALCPTQGHRSHLVLPSVQLQEEVLPWGLRQKERSTSSGQKWALWGLVEVSGASSRHPSPAGL